MIWTPEMDADITRLARDKMSRSNIALRINRRYKTDVTRNAVVGRLGRLGVQTAPRPIAEKNSPAPARVAKPMPTASVGAKSTLPPWPQPSPAPEVRTLLIDLEPGGCRWTDPKAREVPYLFCGAPSYAGSPFCPCHYRMAYQPRGREMAKEDVQ